MTISFKSMNSFWRAAFPRKAFVMAVALATLVLTGVAEDASAATLRGTVKSKAAGLPGYRVSVYATLPGYGGWWRLGGSTTNASGNFKIIYQPFVAGLQTPPLLFVEAVRGRSMLVSAIGLSTNVPQSVVVNERTTVATGTAFAQFVHGWRIGGNFYGTVNAVHMAANLANPRTGAVGSVLRSSPNGRKTSTLRVFNSLANVVASCVAVQQNCLKLFQAATPPGGVAPTNVLQAISNIAKNPSYVASNGKLAFDPLFELSKQRRIYSPYLFGRKSSWLLFLKITGGFYSAQDENNLMNGPGNVAIDERGYVWVNDNYVPQPPGHIACAGLRLIKLTPWGKPVPGTPFFGGGLSGVGYGITLDPKGRVWVGNFGFQDPPCALIPSLAAPNNSVSVFNPNGTPISGPNGYTQGKISWPQGTVSDRQGNIWVANCGNDTVTKIPAGNPNRAFNIRLGAKPPANRPVIKPFGVVTDLNGYVWVTDNGNDNISVISPAGRLIDTLPGKYMGRTVLTHPIGNAADTKGNIWIANSDWLDAPCPTRFQVGTNDNPSITMYRPGTRTPHPNSPFTGGGLTLPWGIAVDGDDTVWAFNFGVIPPGLNSTNVPTGISRFCGVSTSKCPIRTQQVGHPISPNTGYRSNALARITGGQIDRSGNIWVVANWKKDANPFLNPGGNSVAIVIGAAAPIKTPLIGPPVPAWTGR